MDFGKPAGKVVGATWTCCSHQLVVISQESVDLNLPWRGSRNHDHGRGSKHDRAQGGWRWKPLRDMQSCPIDCCCMWVGLLPKVIAR